MIIDLWIAAQRELRRLVHRIPLIDRWLLGELIGPLLFALTALRTTVRTPLHSERVRWPT